MSVLSIFVSKLGIQISQQNNCEASFPESCQRIGKTVCYIVAAVIIEGNKILMVQEAKKSCHGKWYLPAGRVELGESLDVSDLWCLKRCDSLDNE